MTKRQPPEFFRVGQAARPLPEDGKYEDERAAIDRAKLMHDAYGWGVAIAVWDGKDDPVWLFMLGEQFRKV